MKKISFMKHRLNFIFASSAMLVLLATGCSREKDSYQPTKDEIMANAEEMLGIKISPDMDWNMTAQATARITVNGNYGETYTVKIYSNDPLVDKKGYVLKRGQIDNGGTLEIDFEYPKAMEFLVVGITDSHSFTSYKSVRVVDGVLETTFGGVAAEARTTRSMSEPSVAQIEQPYDEAWVADYLETAKEPNSENVADNYDNTSVADCQWYANGGGKLATLMNNYDYCIYVGSPVTQEDKDWYTDNIKTLIENCNWNWNSDSNTAYTILMKLKDYTGDYNYWNLTVNSEGGVVADETFVLNFKITGTYSGGIGVAATEGLTDGVANGNERTVVVTGTWNITSDQKVGSKGKIVIAKGGTVNVAEGKKLQMVNQARLVVLPGGKLTGDGSVEVNNGNAVGEENYNGGTIDVAVFNNNFGKFYNYGKFLVKEYQGGAQESNFYNRSLVAIDHTNSTANARIFNACQWYCKENMRAKIIENVQSSFFYVGGQLMTSGSEDGTGDPSYVSLADGALMRIGQLYNNGTSWVGPTSGTAVVEIGEIVYLNWDLDNTPKSGYFINNIAITLDNKNNFCEGNGMANMTAYEKLKNVVVNGTGGGKNYIGNGRTSFVEKFGAPINIPRDSNFFAGVSGCTPGYDGVGGGVVGKETSDTPDPDPEKPTESNVEPDESAIWSYAFEDTPLGDYDMNDVVLKVCECEDDPTKLEVRLCCAGASFDLHIYFGEQILFDGKEVHYILGQSSGVLVNTGGGPSINYKKNTPAYVKKPENFKFADADFWIKSPAGDVHVAKKGEDPHGIVIPSDWRWPKEWTNIKDAYPNFIEFAKDVESASEEARKWYMTTDTNPVRDKVFTPEE